MSHGAGERRAKEVPGAPEPGERVVVRQRRWVVTDVEAGSMGGAPQHLVTLSSLEEDALGEELVVVWEIEPGAAIHGAGGLPRAKGSDDPRKALALLDAVRWGAVAHAEHKMLHAPFRSGITIEDYQLEPLVRAIDMPRARLLIADDVGLGKTVEAGLVVRELLLRHRARTVLVVCPASLQVKWKEEMRDKFGLDFRIVDTKYLHELRKSRGLRANPWTSYPFLITSMDWAKAGEGLRLLEDVLPPTVEYPRKFDLLIVDEAHNVAPASGKSYLKDSQRTKLIRLLSPHFEHRLFLTATPHNGYRDSFVALLSLLDDSRFARGMDPDPKSVSEVMVRRLKAEIVDEEGKPVFPRRVPLSLDVEYGAEEEAVHAALSEYTASRLERVRGTGAESGERFVLKLLKKRLFSSPAAFAKTLSRYVAGLEGNDRPRKRDEPLDDRVLRRYVREAEEEQADDQAKEAVLDEATVAVAAATLPPTDHERRLLDRMLAWADHAKGRADAKAKAIVEWLDEHVRDGEAWRDERVILFTEYLDTLVWLRGVLIARGFGGERLAVLTGGMDTERREFVKAAFQADPSESKVRILLATDSASEGIDLQRYCNKLLHVDVPWNPNVMEQRNGRIDRHGQRSKEVYVWHPVGKGNGGFAKDTEFLYLLAKKVEQIREDLGSVGPILADRVERGLLGESSRSLEDVSGQTRGGARVGSAALRRMRERVLRLHETLLETKRELGIHPSRLYEVVDVALELSGQPRLRPTRLEGAPEGSIFEVPSLQGAWSRALEGLAHPLTGKRRPITFDHEVAAGRDDVVLVHLDHPLVEMSTRLLRAETWAPEGSGRLHRASVRIVDESLEGPLAVVWFRLVLTGGNRFRLHEEVTFAAGYLRKGGQFVRERRIGFVNELLDRSRDPEAHVADRLVRAVSKEWVGAQDGVLRAIEARSRERMRNLGDALQRKKRREVEDVTRILGELERAIRGELAKAKEAYQPALWPDAEKDQLERDLNALRRRLERIPRELELEKAAMEERYENVAFHSFPVSVVFVFPPHWGVGA